MNPSLTFPLNEMFNSHKATDDFWYALLNVFVARSTQEGWPLPYRPVHLVGELQSFFDKNGIYDLLRADKESLSLVLQERTAYSLSTFQLTGQVSAMVPRSYWFIQRTPKPGEWKSDSPVETGVWDSRLPKTSIPLQNTFVFPFPDKNKVGFLWGDTLQADGVVHVVERLKPTPHDLNPTPMYIPL